MTPSEIRAELMAQHKSLRELAANVRGAASHKSEAEKKELQGWLRLLTKELAAHNQREEELLKEVLPELDAFGDVRKELLDEHHKEEHGRLLSALQAADDGAADALEGALSALDDLLAHMKREEEQILHPDVLRDDLVVVGQSGG